MQIAIRAAIPDVTPDTIWEHFTNAIVPAILNWQLGEGDSNKVGSSSLEELLDQALAKVKDSSDPEDMSDVRVYCSTLIHIQAN